ncbi:MAG: DinB family protein [Planctomycetota bacterium]|jgi:hypothetical protein
MNVEALIRRLESGGGVYAALYANLDHDALHWRPAPGKWSLLDVLCHMLDEEREDFRLRLRLTLAEQGEEWPANDPEGWVVSRNYAERDPDEALAQFLAERSASVEWLAGLESPNWEAVYDHPRGFVISAGDLLLSWVVHDAAHMRQIGKLMIGHADTLGEPFSSDYAGA